MNFKQQIINQLEKATKLPKQQIQDLLEVPPQKELGDYAFPCFILSKKLKKNPVEIALEISNKLKETKNITKFQPTGPYINFFINKTSLANQIIPPILKEKENYGKTKGKQTVVIESPGPNTNKPLHLGHLRNIVLGISLTNLQKAIGNKVIPVDIINDRGIHIAKSVLAYQKYGKKKQPNKKSDHFVGDFYVRYSKEVKKHPKLEEQAYEILKKYEQEDPTTLKLFKKMNNWATKGFQETFHRIGLNQRKAYHESDHYKKGKSIIKENLKKNIFTKDEKNNTIINLEKEGYGEKVVLREDGTSLYITQDLYLAVKRYNDYKMHKMIYIVGSEQIYHFKVLFTILEKLGYKFVKNYYHFPYGMISLPGGRLKSREGTTVDADNLLDNLHDLAAKEIKQRNRKIKGSKLDKRAEKIAQSAIKFFLLKYDPLKDFTFNPKESLSFEGETGPYIQYTSARINSILKKYKKNIKLNSLDNLQEKEETTIITILSKYQETIEKAANEYKPITISHYLIELAQAFNTFYHAHQILKTEPKIMNSRLTLIKAVKQVLDNGLQLLGIEPVEEM